MVKKLCTFVSVILIVVVCTSCSFVNGMSGKTISEKDVDAFLNDSIYAIGYLFAYDSGAADKSELDGDLKVRIAGSTFNTRTGNEVTDDHSYVIEGSHIDEEVNNLFTDNDIDDFENCEFIYRDDNGDYHLINGDWGDTEPVFTITDSHYGLIGSEPTTLTVHYTFANVFDDGDMSDVYDYEMKYTLEGDDSSPYKFKISDISAINLIPVPVIE